MPGRWKKNRNGLTDQQQQFCDYLRAHPDVADGKVYAKFYNVSSLAAANTGASRLLKNANVSRYLEKKQNEAESKADYDQAQWIKDIIRLKEMCMAQEDVRFIVEKTHEDGSIQRIELNKRVFEPAAALRTLEVLAKFKKWLAPKTSPDHSEVQITNGVIFVGADGFGNIYDASGKISKVTKGNDH